ncbi:PREDICTED: uncharacterized protein LOC109238211 [Nicotiana attenuata]|uniref:uncharacterized protein LOC109238211 n=1 Tax=Nicotiana attenuata TaxID=49451 RepID=UPI000904BC1D|nr:PREDICTED: uncharacterized protein LOC109238211 [Nicotiana attenuata]
MPPFLKIYDGTTDPEDHVTHYVTAVKGNDLAKEQVSSILLKKFGETLTGGALTWYSQLPARSIEMFEEMTDKFVTAHAGAKKAEARVNDIFAIKQSPGEGLRDFLARFNHVRMTLANVSEGMVVAAFQNGLSKSGSRATKKLLSRLMKYPPTTWDEIHNAYYAEERGHKTNDCIALRQEVMNMLHQGHLKGLMSDRARDNFARGREQHQGPPKPPSLVRTIQMIIGGGDDASINSVKFTPTQKLKRSITHEWYDELKESIIFDKSDTHSLVFPHYDALVITLPVLDTDVRRIMVDDGSGACIIHPRVLTQIKLEDKIVPCCITLTGFNNEAERTSGEFRCPSWPAALAKWAIELSEHDITYQLQTAIMSQVLANFAADYSEKLMSEVERETAISSTKVHDQWVLYTDDASNASGSGLGLVLEVPAGEMVAQSIRCPDMTNNEAEYEAVIAGLN